MIDKSEERRICREKDPCRDTYPKRHDLDYRKLRTIIRILPIKIHCLSVLTEKVTELEKLRAEGHLDAIALQPEKYFEGVVRKANAGLVIPKLETIGHDLTIFNYSKSTSIPLHIIRSTMAYDINKIKYEMSVYSRDQNLVALINEGDLARARQEFLKAGFSER